MGAAKSRAHLLFKYQLPNFKYRSVSRQLIRLRRRLQSRRHVLRSRQVAGHGVLIHGVHHHLEQVAVAAGVELHGFVDGAVGFFDSAVVGHDKERELVLFRVDLPELQAHGRKAGRFLALLQGELVVVLVAPVFQLFQLTVGRGDQFTGPGQVADGAFQFGFGGVKIAAGGAHVLFDLADIALYTCDFARNRADLLFGLFFLGGQFGVNFLLKVLRFVLERVSAAGKLRAGHADFAGQRLDGRAGFKVALFNVVGNFLLQRRLFTLQIVDAAGGVEPEHNDPDDKCAKNHEQDIAQYRASTLVLRYVRHTDTPNSIFFGDNSLFSRNTALSMPQSQHQRPWPHRIIRRDNPWLDAEYSGYEGRKDAKIAMKSKLS